MINHTCPPDRVAMGCQQAAAIIRQADDTTRSRRLDFRGYGIAIVDMDHHDVSCAVAWAPAYVEWSCGVFTGPFRSVTWTDRRDSGTVTAAGEQPGRRTL